MTNQIMHENNAGVADNAGQPAQNPNPNLPPLDTKQTLAAYLRKSTRTIDAWMARRYLPYLKIGRTVMFNRADVLASLRQRFGINF